MTKIFIKTTVVDEVLTDDARYNILEDAGGAFKADMQIALATSVLTPGTNIDAALLNPLENAVDTLDDMLVTYTTGGTSTAFTLTTPQASALAVDERWRIKFNATPGATPTLNRDSKGAKPLKYYDSTGVKQSISETIIDANAITEILYDGTDYVLINTPRIAIGAEIYSAPNKATIADNDQIGIADSAASYGLKHILFSLVKSTLKTYNDTLYPLLSTKDANGGYAGLTLFKINFKNAANTFTNFLTNATTAARTFTFVDRDAEVGNNINNYSVTAQSPAATTRTYITGSAIAVPAGKLRIGTILRWRFNITKTAAGTAASTYDIAMGTNGSTSDTAIISFTKPAGTAAVDEAWVEIEAIVRGPLSASGIISAHFQMTHNLSTTGHANIPVVNKHTISGTVDVTTANLILGICVTSGASDALTIEQVSAEALNL